MTDKLRPDLKKAIEGLPRERMPEGLEARLTDAMHQHGFIEKPRRVIALTGGRMAGLLAACVSLVIGAYSIGLQRGGGDQPLPGVKLSEPSGRVPVDEPVVEAPESKGKVTVADKAVEAPPVPARAGRAEPTTPAEQKSQEEPEERAKRAEGVVPTLKNEQAKVGETREDQDQFRVTTDEVMAERDQPLKERMEVFTDDNVEEAPASSAPQAMASEAKKSLRYSQPETQTITRELSTPPMIFLLGGTKVVVEAPDSVRVTKDGGGQRLHIYTSDGVISIRLADDD